MLGHRQGIPGWALPLRGQKQGEKIRIIVEKFKNIKEMLLSCTPGSGIARACSGGWLTHLEDQNEEEIEENLRKNERNTRK